MSRFIKLRSGGHIAIAEIVYYGRIPEGKKLDPECNARITVGSRRTYQVFETPEELDARIAEAEEDEREKAREEKKKEQVALTMFMQKWFASIYPNLISRQFGGVVFGEELAKAMNLSTKPDESKGEKK